MARPPLILETWGKIRRTTVGGKPTAVASYRDSDGKTRVMQRQGKTPAEAERKLIAAMKDRIAPVSEIARTTRVRELADLWWEEYQEKDRAPSTRARYQQVLDSHILDALGDLRLEEVSVSRLDRFVKTLANSSKANAKLAHVILQGMFDLAARHDAYEVSPARSIAPIAVPKREIVAWSLDDVAELRAILRAWDAGKPARGRRFGDLADVADFYLGTACRSGEVFAMRWPSVHLDETPRSPRCAALSCAARRAARHASSRSTPSPRRGCASFSSRRSSLPCSCVVDSTRRRRSSSRPRSARSAHPATS